jgi:autotransporter translocation and assembly factor TamB
MSTRHTTFREVMEGTIRLAGEDSPRPIRLDLNVDLPGLIHPWSDLEGPMTGHVHVEGWADDTGAVGTLQVAPLAAGRIRYQISFTASDGRRLRFDGWKSIQLSRPARSMTRLPATVTDADGAVLGEASLRFQLRRDLVGFLSGFRFPAGEDAEPAEDLLRSRWRGQAGRLEVWYTTLTDPVTGTGAWIHHELVSPHDGGAARAHGWAALFPPGEEPVLARFGPSDWAAPESGFACDGVEMTAERLRGKVGELSWDLSAGDGAPAAGAAGDGVAAGRPLFTFPRWAWQREVLPAAQIVPVPAATFTGTLRHGDRVIELTGAPGATARIYGHGNARRWAWLHADLGGGDVCEVVAAVSTRPGLDRLAPLPFVRLRVGGRDWPPGGLLAALRLRARIGLPEWTVTGRIGGRMLRIEVTQPPAETVAVDYQDPDGSPAVCHNTERASAVINLSRRSGGEWEQERCWRLDGTAHAEVGLR